MMFEVVKEIKRDMAHRLPNHKGKCFNVHGHTYKALIQLAKPATMENGEEEGMVKDFGNFKIIKDRIDENWDHSYVGKQGDEVLEFLKEKGFKVYELETSPTAEMMSKYLFDKIMEFGIFPVSVTIYETPTSYAKYSYNLPF